MSHLDENDWSAMSAMFGSGTLDLLDVRASLAPDTALDWYRILLHCSSLSRPRREWSRAEFDGACSEIRESRLRDQHSNSGDGKIGSTRLSFLFFSPPIIVLKSAVCSTVALMIASCPNQYNARPWLAQAIN